MSIIITIIDGQNLNPPRSIRKKSTKQKCTLLAPLPPIDVYERKQRIIYALTFLLFFKVYVFCLYVFLYFEPARAARLPLNVLEEKERDSQFFLFNPTNCSIIYRRAEEALEKSHNGKLKKENPHSSPVNSSSIRSQKSRRQSSCGRIQH